MTPPRTPRLAGLAAAAGLMLLAPFALAQSEPAAGSGALPPAFAAADTDGDGMISPAEWQALTERLPARMRAGLERALADPADLRAARAAAMIEMLDTDGDGLISAAELAAGMERWAAAAGETGWRAAARDSGWHHGAGRRAEAAPTRASGWSRSDMRPDMRGDRPRMGRPAAARMGFDAIDTDGDGMISRAEFDAAMAQRPGPRARAGAAPVEAPTEPSVESPADTPAE